MKYLFSVFFLAFAGQAFGAIEFSEELDQFAPEPTSVTAASSDVSDAAVTAAPTIRNAGNATASNAALTSAQSTGVVGSMNGPLPLNNSGLAASTIRGGGANGGVGSQEGSDDLLAEAQVTEAQRGGATSSLMVEPQVVSMPEPGTAIVWSLLAVCGLGVYRKRQ